MFAKNVFSSRLKNLRTNKNMSLEKFGALFGVSKQSAQRWEAEVNIPTAENLVDIASYFDVSIDYLVGRTDNPNSHKS